MSLVTRTRAVAPIFFATLALLAGTATPARADITAFLGMSPTPERHSVKGFSGGLSLLVVGFEFEYSHLGEETDQTLPGLKTYSGNVLVQTPVEIKGTQFYGTAGAGGYQEYLGSRDETHFGLNFGGGIKVRVVGPVRLRLDYRVFRLKGEPLFPTYQRFYAGANLAF
jgi:hypothetical protein